MLISVAEMGSDMVANHAAQGTFRGSGALLHLLDTWQPMEMDRISNPAVHDAATVAPSNGHLAMVISPLIAWGDQATTKQCTSPVQPSDRHYSTGSYRPFF